MSLGELTYVQANRPQFSFLLWEEQDRTRETGGNRAKDGTQEAKSSTEIYCNTELESRV